MSKIFNSDQFLNNISKELQLEIPITHNNKIMDLGLDSLALIQLLVYLEELYKITFLDEDLSIDAETTIKDLEYRIRSKM